MWWNVMCEIENILCQRDLYDFTWTLYKILTHEVVVYICFLLCLTCDGSSATGDCLWVWVAFG